MPRFTFFIGKGGVGKTTVSAAYALDRAASHPRETLLLLSTDPAHSLGDVLDVQLTDRAKRLQTPGKLWARELNAERQIKAFLATERADLVDMLNRGSLFTSEELEPLLDTALPGMAEVAALLAVHELLDGDFEEVAVDTAPMGHAIRLFQMPEHFARFLRVLEKAAERDSVLARHFGGSVQREPLLDRWTRMVKRVTEALSPEAAKLLLVTTPDPFSLNEAARSAPAFVDSLPANRIGAVILNRMVEGQSTCVRCQHRAIRSRKALGFLAKHFARVQVFTGVDPGGPIIGIEPLRQFGKHVFSGSKLAKTIVGQPPKSIPLTLTPVPWPHLRAPLTMTIGKGGVGKTTISAALAVNHRAQTGEAVTICSIDPAPSLADIFAVKIGRELKPVAGDRKLRAAELDAGAEFKSWAGEMRTRLKEAMTGEQRGVHVDLSLDREFLLALLDVVPPGVDEVFAIFQILDLLENEERVVIDMAPTGHALEVLRMPERLLAWARVLLKTLAAHRTLPFARDAAVELANLSQKVRAVAAILQDKKRCRISVVTLPEPLPDYETRRLLRLLRELKAPVGEIFINRVLTEGNSRCRRCRPAMEWQNASIGKLRRLSGGFELFVVTEFDRPIAGDTALRKFTRQLWRLA